MFQIKRLAIPDMVAIDPQVIPDGRGFFMEVMKKSEFEAFGLKKPLVQVNYSKSSKGVLRGLHYQRAPYAQGKLVRCLKGEIFDVGVDIRRGSPFYGKCVSLILSEDNKRMLYIPEGFAHGFCVLSDVAEVEYFCTQEYAPDDEGGIVWNDPDVKIAWPLEAPIIASRDLKWPRLKEL